MDAKSIVNENFKGLDKLINSEDLTHFYKSLIETCLDEYAKKKAVELLNWKNENEEKITTHPRRANLWLYEGKEVNSDELYQIFEDATNHSKG